MTNLRSGGARVRERGPRSCNEPASSTDRRRRNDPGSVSSHGLRSSRQTVQELGLRRVPPASAALFFGGRPVTGLVAYESESGGLQRLQCSRTSSPKVMGPTMRAASVNVVSYRTKAHPLSISRIICEDRWFLHGGSASQQPLFGTRRFKMAIATDTSLARCFRRRRQEQFKPPWRQ